MTTLLAASDAPAGGAATSEVLIATAGAMLLTAGLLVLGIGHRSGRLGVLRSLAAFSERVSGIPGWAALPAGVAAPSLLAALFGMLWDISLHIAEGRDPGPLANPAHYFILLGLFGVFAAGFLAIVLPSERPSATSLRIADGWYAPLGGVLMVACAGFALIGFPLDDMWHRLFGQDVTLWGPTHLMLIGGASLTLVGMAVLLVEAMRARPAGARGELGWALQARRIALTGAFLLGLSTFQGEFDFGVPQFRFVFEPMLVMLAAGTALVAARVWLGRGAAIGAAVFFLVVRGGIAVLVGPVLGEPTPHFPLYLPEAVLVELAGLWFGGRRPLALAATSGALIGTVGFASEWGWSHAFMPYPWPSALLPEAALLGLVMAVAGALLGAWIGQRLASDRLPRTRSLRYAAVGAAVAVAASVGYGLYSPPLEGASANVRLTQVRGGPDRSVLATVRVDPPSAADDAEWFNVTAWQGGGLHVVRLHRVAPGLYRTRHAVPVHGDWKVSIRLQRGTAIAGMPVYMPAEPAIPAPAVPARPRFDRRFVEDHEVLQREQKEGVQPWLWPAAVSVVLALTLALLTLLAWGLHRLALAAGRGPEAAPPRAPARQPTAPTRPRLGVGT